MRVASVGIEKLRQVMLELRKRGCENQCTHGELMHTISRVTGIVDPRILGIWRKALEEQGFIETLQKGRLYKILRFPAAKEVER